MHAGVAARAKQGNASSTKAAAIGGDTVLRSLAARALAIIEVQGQGRQVRAIVWYEPPLMCVASNEVG